MNYSTMNYSKHPNPSKASFLEALRNRAREHRMLAKPIVEVERDPRLSADAWADTAGTVEKEEEPEN